MIIIAMIIIGIIMMMMMITVVTENNFAFGFHLYAAGLFCFYLFFGLFVLRFLCY